MVGLGLLGADRPPPPGFLVVVLMAAALVVLIAFAMPRWRAVKGLPECNRVRGPAGQGAAVGLALWLLALLLPFSGEPSVELTVADHLVSGALAASIGALVATVLARIA